MDENLRLILPVFPEQADHDKDGQHHDIGNGGEQVL
jgi:hypothetical protein